MLRPCCFSQVRSATSWVLPSCGVAIFLPLRSAGLVIDGFTTRNAPPDAAPDDDADRLPFDFWKALIDGSGADERRRRARRRRARWYVGAGVERAAASSVTFLPRSFWKMPPWMPTSAGAWVTLGK